LLLLLLWWRRLRNIFNRYLDGIRGLLSSPHRRAALRRELARGYILLLNSSRFTLTLHSACSQ
jgi:hypothetical protein